MGRTLPSTTQLAFDLIAELKPFYGALRRNDQLILDKFFEAALQHRAAISNAVNLLPMELMPIAVLLEERKRNDRRFDELLSHMMIQVEYLYKELDRRLNIALPSETNAKSVDITET